MRVDKTIDKVLDTVTLIGGWYRRLMPKPIRFLLHPIFTVVFVVFVVFVVVFALPAAAVFRVVRALAEAYEDFDDEEGRQ